MRRTRFAAALLSLIAAVSCAMPAIAASGFVVALPNGYEMIRGKQSEPTIVKRKGSRVVPGPIAAFTVIRDVVTGRVQPLATASASNKKPTAPAAADEKAASAPSEAKPTYFVLNTRTGEVAMGLTEEAWNERLKQLNIPASPELNPPLLPQ